MSAVLMCSILHNYLVIIVAKVRQLFVKNKLDFLLLPVSSVYLNQGEEYLNGNRSFPSKADRSTWKENDRRSV